MKYYDRTLKRVVFYLIGLFILTSGISLSIYANLGVSPGSVFPYALTLATGISVGIMTIFTNMGFIFIQWILTKKFNLQSYILQMVLAFLFGFFTDLTLWLVRHILPAPESLLLATTYLLLSLFIVAVGLLFYVNTGLLMMPYDTLIAVVSKTFHMDFSKAKVICDLINVIVSLIFCLIVLQNFGSVGFGTLIAAIFIGKILGVYMKLWRDKFITWVMYSKFEK